MKVGIVNYGCGNIFSLKCSLNAIGAESVLIENVRDINKCDRIILPGVGAFGDAMRLLAQSGMDSVVKKAAKDGMPLLGICLGMQLLFDKSYEFGEHDGLSLVSGKVVPLAEKLPQSYKIPHMGWNTLDIKRRDGLFKYTTSGERVYFVHSYYATDCIPYTTATTDYGAEICAAVGNGNVFGTQFHPEKSGEAGLKILRAFTEL